ncbi:head-tail connector protein [Methylobacterium gnaphalii]|uniref:Phage gp6-like head-tail connector protein n=1 Tax=Methylobacterium gnaphalii TaxID=1010610 RepID=A0A512JQN6_9HYPH|nr:hypothetical protein [Methylobacterium gnaphalii]GEP12259.1 hypothetical protein MGN01_41040 [Methylobacterium gnaphalii]GJD68737.1 hypothetical protein MMMDOFMJ_1661 [Methylobacterium gnaphalii]GLS49366.1 hypothetical protein GCM10007885_22140 [Methylobacterium gnaphalii]
MSVVVITPPAALLTPAEAATHLRIDTGEESEYLVGLIAAAQGTIDGPPGWLGISIGLQTLELRAPSFEGFTNGGIILPFGPIVDIVSVSYVAVSGVLTVLDPAAYRLDVDGGLERADGAMWPPLQLRHNAVRVRYRAGYAPTTDNPPKSTVPAAILHAMKVMVGLLYENRAGAADLQTNATVSSLLSPFRVWGR